MLMEKTKVTNEENNNRFASAAYCTITWKDFKDFEPRAGGWITKEMEQGRG